MNVSLNRLSSAIARTFTATLLVALFGASLAFGQDYKEAFNAGITAAKANNLQVALDKLAEAATGAHSENDTTVERQARNLIAKIEYNLGIAALKSEQFPSALTHFENGVTNDPTFAKNYLGRSQVLLKQDKFDDAIAAYFQTMQVAEENSDSQTSRAAESAIRDQYVFKASSALARNGNNPRQADADAAIENLEALQQYVDANSDVHYYLAESYKVKGQFDLAIEHANTAIEMSNGSATSKARIYYVKGESLMSKGQNAEAVAAFRNALFGSYRAPAQHFIETLGT